jgi:hypothetical protein
MQIPKKFYFLLQSFREKTISTKNYSISQARMLVTFAQQMKLFEKEAKFSKKS